MFVVNGVLVASWIARIPDVRTALELTDGRLGLVLLAMSVGIVAALPLAGGLVGRLGSRTVVAIGSAVAVSGLVLVPLADRPSTLAACLVIFGAGTSTMDVAMNAHGIGVEHAYGRSILVGFHAAWSIGTLLAAGIGAVAVSARVPVGAHLAVTGVVGVAVTVAALPWLRAPDRAATGPRHEDRAPVLALPRGRLVPLALIAFGATVGEHTGADWSGIVMGDVVGVADDHVGWGLVAFTAAMTTSRLLGDRIADRIGAARTVSLGGGLAAGGFLWLILVPNPVLAVLGFVAVGAGVASTTPLAFSAAGRVGRSAGEGVAAVATVGYAGMLVAPPLIGSVAEYTHLRVSLLVVAVIVVACTLRPGSLRAAAGTPSAT